MEIQKRSSGFSGSYHESSMPRNHSAPTFSAYYTPPSLEEPITSQRWGTLPKPKSDAPRKYKKPCASMQEATSFLSNPINIALTLLVLAAIVLAYNQVFQRLVDRQSLQKTHPETFTTNPYQVSSFCKLTRRFFISILHVRDSWKGNLTFNCKTLK